MGKWQFSNILAHSVTIAKSMREKPSHTRSNTMDGQIETVRLAGSVLHRSRHVCAFFHKKDEEYALKLRKATSDPRQHIPKNLADSPASDADQY